jgi:zinc transport system permease protein
MSEFFEVLISGEGRFLRLTLLIGWVSALPLGCVGSLVVTRRISSLAGSIAHFSLSGIGFILWAREFWGWQISPVLGALGSGLVAAGLLAWLGRRPGQREDSWVTILWAGGMSVGLLFISSLPVSVDPMSYLFGDVLLVDGSDVLWVSVLSLMVMALLLLAYRPLLAVAWNESLARVSGLPVLSIRLLLLSLIVVTVVLMLKIMGIVLVLGLLVLPAATAGMYVRRLKPLMVTASLLSGVYVTLGLWISYGLNWPTGAVTVLLAAMVHVASIAIVRR